MTKKTLIFIVISAGVLFSIRIIMLVFVNYLPEKSNIYLQIGLYNYLGWLRDPVILLAICLAIIILLIVMLLIWRGKSYANSKLNVDSNQGQESSLKKSQWLLLALVVFLVIAFYLWLSHGAYIASHYRLAGSALLYYFCNPLSDPLGYWYWRYSLNAPRMVVCVLLSPILVPYFVYFIPLLMKKKVKR